MKYKDRRIVFKANLQADTLDDLRGYLRSVIFKIDTLTEERPYSSVSGGYSTGGNWEIEINEDMDGDKYREWLEKTTLP